MLVIQHLLVCVKGFRRARRLWLRSFFSSTVPLVLSVLFGWFLRWKVGGHTAVVFWDATSRICSLSHAAFLCNCCQTFLYTLYLCIDIVVWIRLLPRRNCILFYRTGLNSIWPIAYQSLPMPLIVVYWCLFQ